MLRQERQALANRVSHYYENVAGRDKFKTVSHFSAEGFAKSTIYRRLSRFEKRGSVEFYEIPGRPVSEERKNLDKRVSRLYSKDPNISERRAAVQLGISKTYLHQVKVKESGIKSYVRTAAPHYTEKQKSRAQTACRKIVEKKPR